ncbi:MAG: aldehyde ferredoxin oxidoreductase [Bacteroidia bacterium]|nr:aldehyde ferredoxin oxidoreductase [Bacteroidia bacterium]
MKTNIKVLMLDASTGYYKTARYPLGSFFGPVDLGLHLSGKYHSLNIGAGLFAGSIFPGSNRMLFTGFSPCWVGFYISSMGGAALVFDNLGINMLSIINKAPTPSVLYLNRTHGEEVEIEIVPLELTRVWEQDRGGIYSLMDYTYKCFGGRYKTDPRILATGQASLATDFGAIASVPIKNGQLSFVDTWAGRGGFGTKMLKNHGIAAVIYGGTCIEEDFRDRKVADEWFEHKYHKKLAARDFESTAKYRFEPKFHTGGTFGVNYATIGGNILAFNYRSIYWSEEERVELHKKFILDHYLKQFNEETIDTKQQKNCGEPCVAICKKMRDEYKKDYEPYQTMGPLCGIFDQRAAEVINHHADMYGFDGISAGGVLAWLMECLSDGSLSPQELQVSGIPVFSQENFRIVEDSMFNAKLGIELLNNIIYKKGILNLEEGARKFARQLSREKSKKILDKFVYTAYGRRGWMVPNQYWTPGVLSPMSIMGKYYMQYSNEFITPRELGRKNAERMKKELILDNTGVCRFHRAWAEEMIPEIVEHLYNLKNEFFEIIDITASRINSRNSSIFWESERNFDYIYTFLKKKHITENLNNPELINWIKRFEENKFEAAQDFWYEMLRGSNESLHEF